MPTYPDMSALRYRALQPLALPLPPAELFEFQVEKLREKGLVLTDADVNRLCQFVPNDPQRFLVVPRRPGTLDLDHLMNLIEINGIRGQSYMDPPALDRRCYRPTKRTSPPRR